MQRIPEPELMLNAEQASAYAQADFAVPHQQIADRFRDVFPELILTGTILDLGCGPADLLIRFAKAWPEAQFHGIDGSPAMLAEGRPAIAAANLNSRISLYHQLLPADSLPLPSYQAVISNSLLHHLHYPEVLWQTIKQAAAPKTAIYITDLCRPDSTNQALNLVNTYSADEPQILKQDFYHSLLAAFTLDEIQLQLNEAGLASLQVAITSDRHIQISGYITT
ncbi:MAG: class I SAM-dependent methyltransferase [Immundisolibacteraceae bacterium]|nr:class I SAM-dependent methyltransferase [Immundisolibacteraceae bacterium]